jgi:hypothetical protein
MLFLRGYLFFAPSLLLGCCAFLLWRRRLHSIYPIFWAYVGFQLLQFIVLFATYLLIFPSISHAPHSVVERYDLATRQMTMLRLLRQPAEVSNAM